MSEQPTDPEEIKARANADPEIQVHVYIYIIETLFNGKYLILLFVCCSNRRFLLTQQ